MAAHDAFVENQMQQPQTHQSFDKVQDDTLSNAQSLGDLTNFGDAISSGRLIPARSAGLPEQ